MSPQTAAPPRRFVRRTDDRIVGGVAAGLADVLGVDPVLVRVGFVVLAFAGGAGIIAYLALWALTPEGDPQGPRPVAQDRGAAFWVAIGLFVLAALAIADSVGDRSFVWPLVLIGAGVALWRSDLRGGPPPPTFGAGDAATATPPPPTSAGADEAPSTPETETAEAWPGSDDREAPAGPRWAPPPPPGGPRGRRDGRGGAGWGPPSHRERSVLGRLTVGVALVTVGVLAALDRLDVLDLTLRDGVAVALLVVGLGLVVGTWFGRARWLSIPAALLLVPALLVSTVAHELDVPIGSGIGERSHGTTAVDDIDPVYELGVGRLALDFGDLRLADRTAETAARVGLGQIEIVVPDDATVAVTWEVAGGRVELFGNAVEGRPVRGTEVFEGEPGAGRLDLTVEAAFGQIEVVRASDAGFRRPGRSDPFVPFGRAGLGPRR